MSGERTDDGFLIRTLKKKSAKRAAAILGIIAAACAIYFSGKQINEIEKGVEYFSANAPNINQTAVKTSENPPVKETPPDRPARRPDRRIMNPEQIYAQADYAIKLRIFKKITIPFSGQVVPFDTGSFGSGFITRDKSICKKYKRCVVTAFHVVNGNDASMAYFAEFRDGSKAQMLELISGTAAYDAAVLRFVDGRYRPKKAARIGRSSELKPGSPIYAIGSNRFGDFWMSGDGRLYTKAGSAKYGLKKILEASGIYHPDILLFNTPIFHGFSGGPLINKYGEVIGITTAMTQLDMDAIYIGSPIDGIRKTLKKIK